MRPLPTVEAKIGDPGHRRETEPWPPLDFRPGKTFLSERMTPGFEASVGSLTPARVLFCNMRDFDGAVQEIETDRGDRSEGLKRPVDGANWRQSVRVAALRGSYTPLTWLQGVRDISDSKALSAAVEASLRGARAFSRHS